jgi:hypothetical protein
MFNSPSTSGNTVLGSASVARSAAGPHSSTDRVLQPAQRIIETLAIPALTRADSQIAPLPVPELEPLTGSSTARFALVRVDGSGAVASKGTVRFLGWPAGLPIRYDVRCGLIVVSASPEAARLVPTKLNLVLPAQVRARCRIQAGDQLLLAALIEHELLVIYSQRRLYDMVIAYHDILRAEPGKLP